MKKYLFLMLTVLGLILSFSSCSSDNNDENNNTEFASLFRTTDYFVEQLYTVYEHYDAFGKHSTKTSDNTFTVTPIGRMIIVKIDLFSDLTYTKVKDALKSHYQGNYKVKDVFLNNGGTITIDCRK